MAITFDGINVTVDVFGDKQLMRKLHKLEQTAQKTIIRKAVRAGAAPVRKALRRNAPEQDPAEREANKARLREQGLEPFEILKKSIRTKYKQYRGAYFAVTGPEWPEASHGLWQELRGPNKGWARRSWDQSANDSAKAVEDKLRREILAVS
jgi:hypothetical protein